MELTWTWFKQIKDIMENYILLFLAVKANSLNCQEIGLFYILENDLIID